LITNTQYVRTELKIAEAGTEELFRIYLFDGTNYRLKVKNPKERIVTIWKEDYFCPNDIVSGERISFISKISDRTEMVYVKKIWDITRLKKKESETKVTKRNSEGLG